MINVFEVESVTFQGPFFNKEDEEMKDDDADQIVDQSSKKVGTSGRVTVDKRLLEERSFNDFGVSMQSTKVYLKAKIEFKSEEPVECITCTYKVDDPEQTHYDYYSCKTCNINWICMNCNVGCHSGCQTLPHIMNHRPTYACCYCVKKKKCKIRNIKNMDQKAN